MPYCFTFLLQELPSKVWNQYDNSNISLINENLHQICPKFDDITTFIYDLCITRLNELKI